MSILLTILALLLVALLVPARAEVLATTTPKVHAAVRVGWPFGLLAVGWRTRAGFTVWAGKRAFSPARRPRRPPKKQKAKRATKGAGALAAIRAQWASRGSTPGLLRLARPLLRALRLRASGSLAITWDDPFLVCQVEGLRLAVDGAARRPTRWLSLTIGRPALEADVRVRATLWLPQLGFIVLRWLLGPDGRAARHAWRRRRATRHSKGARPWSRSRSSSGASPTA